MKPSFLSKSVAKNLGLHWRPIFELMEEAPGLDLSNTEESFVQAKAYLKTRLGYVFLKQNARPDEWSLSTWSKHSKQSVIEAHGTPDDISKLPPRNAKNCKRKQPSEGRKNRPGDDHRRKRGRRSRRQTANNNVNRPAAVGGRATANRLRETSGRNGRQQQQQYDIRGLT